MRTKYMELALYLLSESSSKIDEAYELGGTLLDRDDELQFKYQAELCSCLDKLQNAYDLLLEWKQNKEGEQW